MITRTDWAAWIDELPATGRLVFELKEVIEKTHGNVVAGRAAIARAVKNKRIIRIGNGLYAYVSPEFRQLGAPPFEWVLRSIFEHLSRPYYLGLLSAAAHHGASHQKPMAIHVVVSRQMRPFKYGPHHVHYFYKKTWPSAGFLEERSAPTGKFLISNPWLTLLDLVRYPKYSGGLDNLATIIKEIDLSGTSPKKTEIESLAIETSALQRLGWMLSAFGKRPHSDLLQKVLSKRRVFPVLLEPGGNRKGSVDKRFSIIVNYQPEAEA